MNECLYRSRGLQCPACDRYDNRIARHAKPYAVQAERTAVLAANLRGHTPTHRAL